MSKFRVKGKATVDIDEIVVVDDTEMSSVDINEIVIADEQEMAIERMYESTGLSAFDFFDEDFIVKKVGDDYDL